MVAPIIAGEPDNEQTRQESHDTSYEVHLDPDPDPDGRGPVYVDAVVREHTAMPIIPAAWRGWANIQATMRRAVGRWCHVVAFHAVRLPRYVALASLWSVVGVGRLLARSWSWAYDMEQGAARRAAAERGEFGAYMSMIREADSHRRHRVPLFLAAMVGLMIAACVFLSLPVLLKAVVLAVVVPVLAHVGRPIDKPIVTPAVVAPRFRVINADVVLRAYYAAGLGHPDKQPIQFGSPMSRDGEGSTVLVDLPYGKGFSDTIRAREAIASGLDVAVSQVFLTRDPTSNRRHRLWVADRDPLAVPAGRTPLLRCQPTDIWKPAPFGVDERGRKVELGMLWNSILVGAQPRQGKTFSARQLALYAALDPYCRLTVFDGKGSPDWRRFSLVADRYGFGLAMTKDGDPVEVLLDTLRAIKADVQDRYERLSDLASRAVELCPEGKLTRELARDKRFGMPVHLVVLDEFQEYFDLGEVSKEVAALLVYLVKVAPAAGVILLGATQRPSGVGSGQVAQQFVSFRDNFQIRFSLRTGSWQMSDLVLGAGAYSEGYDSSTLLPTYKGVGVLRGATDDTPTVRTYLADGQDADKILTAARALRERAGTLSGMAAGETVEQTARDPLADVIRVWSFIDRPKLHWSRLAELLAEHMPESYADITADALSALLRDQGVPSVQVKADGVNQRGCDRAAVEAALKRREITSG